MFQIPPARGGYRRRLRGILRPKTESLGPLSIHEIEQIREQITHERLVGQNVRWGDAERLDPQAIEFARQEFKTKHPDLATEVDRWDDHTFLNKAKVCINGRITRTAIILLGKNEAEHYLSPGIARITWILKDEHGNEKDYQHFGPPLILAVDQVFAKVRNLTYRYLPNASLFPTEITQYDPWVIRETLHNCIAHQRLSRKGEDQRGGGTGIVAVHERRRIPARQRGRGRFVRDAPPRCIRTVFWRKRWSI